MRIGPQRPINPDAIVAPQGYRVEALITGLTFPSALSFGPGGEIYLAESGGVGGLAVSVPRVLRADPDRTITEIGRLENPIFGLVYRSGELLIGEDGPSPRILRVTAEGDVQVLVQGLPGGGDYGLSGLSLDVTGAVLFGLGTRTNSGVVGLDNAARGWVSAHPEWGDVPGQEVELAGVNYVTTGPVGGGARSITGGLKPFGRRAEPEEKVGGSAICGGAVYRLPLEATEPERLAWGLRNPLGVAAGPDGRLYASEGGMEERGSRPIGAAPDCLWEIRAGSYYGWPDYAGGAPVTDPRFRVPGHPQPRMLLSNGPRLAGAPVATFPARSGIGRFDFSTSEAFGFAGEALVALSGPWTTGLYPDDRTPAPGHRVVRVDPRTGVTTDFLVNRDGSPSGGRGGGGMERPFDVQFDPSGEVLYVLDLGEIHCNREIGLEPYGGTGVLWRITRARPMLLVSPVQEPAADEDEEEAGEPEGAASDEPAEPAAGVEMLPEPEGEGDAEPEAGAAEQGPDEGERRPVVESVFEEEAPPLESEASSAHPEEGSGEEPAVPEGEGETTGADDEGLAAPSAASPDESAAEAAGENTGAELPEGAAGEPSPYTGSGSEG